MEDRKLLDTKLTNRELVSKVQKTGMTKEQLKFHFETLEIFEHIEDAICFLEDPYCENIALYKQYLALLLDTVRLLHDALPMKYEENQQTKLIRTKLIKLESQKKSIF